MRTDSVVIAKFSPGFFGTLLSSSGTWQFELAKDRTIFNQGNNHRIDIKYDDINKFEHSLGSIWSTISISSNSITISFDGIANENANHLLSLLKSNILTVLTRSFEEHEQQIINSAKSFKYLLNKDIYVSNTDLRIWNENLQTKLGKDFGKIKRLINSNFIDGIQVNRSSLNSLLTLREAFSFNLSALNLRNEKFIEDEMREHSKFFETIENTPLTLEQQRAAIIMEDRNLLIASAGSGKTSTIIGKIGYCLCKKFYKPDEILVLSYNNNSVKEVDERIRERLGKDVENSKVMVKTFHALGLEIIAEVEDKKPTVFSASPGELGLNGTIFDSILSDLNNTDPSFFQDYLAFKIQFPYPIINPSRFDSIEDYELFIKSTGSYSNKKNGFLTLNGELVKSQGELAIANWLFKNGVEYLYEPIYKYVTADKEHRQYQPDFYLSKYDIYIEHYALDHNGNPPKAFGEKYRQSIEWKRILHETKKTRLVETTFAEFISGVLFEDLEKKLLKYNVTLCLKSNKELAKIIEAQNQSKSDDVAILLESFLRHFKSNQMTKVILDDKRIDKENEARSQIFIRIFEKFLSKYKSFLNGNSLVDFDDMIIKASLYAKNGNHVHNYKLIVVDEFQDISQSRANLLVGLLSCNRQIKLFVVGDDYQSIYRFAGSDISLFKEFGSKFGFSSINVLSKTFRSNKGLTDVATSFIQKNESQIKKSVVATDSTYMKVIKIVKIRDFEKDNITEIYKSILSEIRSQAASAKCMRRVFFLGRYNSNHPANLSELHDSVRDWVQLEFKTIHGSKGLQADHVVLIGMNSGRKGFPTNISDDPLLSLVMPTPEDYPHAEERRLMYVALTRARHSVYLVANQYACSEFVSEVENMPGIEAVLDYPEFSSEVQTDAPREKCPKCGQGWVVQKQGKYGPFLGCSRFPNCNYSRNQVKLKTCSPENDKSKGKEPTCPF